MNTLKVGLLMAALTALFVTMGNVLGGTSGMIIAVLFAAVMNIGTYWFSDKIVLSMTRAQPVSPQQAPELYSMTQSLAQKAEIPMPRLYIVPDPSPNAFATGRNPANGVVAVNEGLLNILNREEIEGVIAHEIAHIKHRDTLTSAIVATLAGAISGIANMLMWSSLLGGGDEDNPNPLGALLMMVLAPMAAMMIQFAVSRAREFEADKTAAILTGNPNGLKSALVNLHRGVAARPSHVNPSMAQMCIVNPFSGGMSIAKLFSTHPPMEERVRKLDELARSMGR